MYDYLIDACNNIDAAVFSSDVLYNEATRSELKEYAERWLRAIAEHEKLETENE